MAEPEIKRLPISEFRERGYLHEVNRLVLHPLGLALEINQHEHHYRRVVLREKAVAELLQLCREVFTGRGGLSMDTATVLYDALSRAEMLEPGDETLGGVWDSQDDPEGTVYGEDLLSPEKAESVCQELLARRDERRKRTGGWVIQPLPDHQVLSTTYTDPTLRSTGEEVVEPGQFAGVDLPPEEEA